MLIPKIIQLSIVFRTNLLQSLQCVVLKPFCSELFECSIVSLS